MARIDIRAHHPCYLQGNHPGMKLFILGPPVITDDTGSGWYLQSIVPKKRNPRLMDGAIVIRRIFTGQAKLISLNNANVTTPVEQVNFGYM